MGSVRARRVRREKNRRDRARRRVRRTVLPRQMCAMNSAAHVHEILPFVGKREVRQLLASGLVERFVARRAVPVLEEYEAALVERGAQRTEAYEAIQRNAMEVWERGASFQDLVSKDPFVTKHLSAAEIVSCFDPKYYLRHIGNIYQRVFGSTSGKENSGSGRKSRQAGKRGARKSG